VRGRDSGTRAGLKVETPWPRGFHGRGTPPGLCDGHGSRPARFLAGCLAPPRKDPLHKLPPPRYPYGMLGHPTEIRERARDAFVNGEGTGAYILRKLGISRATFCRWRAEDGWDEQRNEVEQEARRKSIEELAEKRHRFQENCLDLWNFLHGQMLLRAKRYGLELEMPLDEAQGMSKVLLAVQSGYFMCLGVDPKLEARFAAETKPRQVMIDYEPQEGVFDVIVDEEGTGTVVEGKEFLPAVVTVKKNGHGNGNGGNGHGNGHSNGHGHGANGHGNGHGHANGNGHSNGHGNGNGHAGAGHETDEDSPGASPMASKGQSAKSGPDGASGAFGKGSGNGPGPGRSGPIIGRG
jgi:hypothetical protein